MRYRGRLLETMLALLLTLLAGPSWAQAPSAARPDGLPPSHPPIGEAAGHSAPGSREMDLGGMPRRDVSAPSSSVPPGTVRVTVVSPLGEPFAGAPVSLVQLTQGGPTSETEPARSGVSDSQGRVEFAGIPASESTGYRVTVDHASTSYRSTPFRVLPTAGHEVIVHVYPTTRKLDETQVAMRAFVFVEPRSDLFQFEVLLQLNNVGTVTWLPADISMRLPEGAQAFTSKDSNSGLRFAADGDEVATLHGTVPPGAHEVAFSFQVPNDEGSTAHFEFTLPPRVAEARILAEAGRHTTLMVDGFPPATRSTNPHGQVILATQTSVQAAGVPLDGLSLTLGGLPPGNSGRWYALLAALALAGGGIRIAWISGRSGRSARKEIAQQLSQARNLMLEELVQLHRARRAGQVGPQAYDTARGVLIDALARLELLRPKSKTKRSRPSRSQA